MQYGHVKFWDISKGYGFITTDDDQDIFVHKSGLDITLNSVDLKEGLRLKFDVRSDIKGDKAINVRKA